MLQRLASMAAGKTLGDLLTFLLFLVLSRIYGEAGLGVYSFAMALTSSLIVMADYGLLNYSVKEVSSGEIDIHQFYSSVVWLRLLLLLLVSLILIVGLIQLDPSSNVFWAIVIIWLYHVFYIFYDVCMSLFLVHEDAKLAGFFELLLRGLIALSGCALAISEAPLLVTLLAFPVSAFFVLLVALVTVYRKYGAIFTFSKFESLTTLMKEARSFALFNLLRQVATRSDILMLGLLIGMGAVGIYNAAYRIVFFVMVLSYFISLTILPTASTLFSESKERFASFFQQTMDVVMLIAIPVAVGLFLVANEVIDLLYGTSFAASAEILGVLSGVAFFNILINVLGVFLTASNQQSVRTSSQWIASMGNLSLNLIFISLWQEMGAAIATLISEGFVVLYLIYRIRNTTRFPDCWLRVFFASLGAMVFYIAFSHIMSVELWVVVPGSILLYILVLSLSGRIRRQELQVLTNLIKR